MDFRTIRTNLETNVYDSPEAFAEHVRLTFRNAIAYNQSRDNPVHIAAREMMNKFEEKYRIMVPQKVSTTIETAENEGPSSEMIQVSGKAASKRARKSSATTKELYSMNNSSIPAPPSALMGGITSIEDMQRKMQEMENEIHRLRTVVQHKEVQQSVETSR